jgi:hypothetical protein
MQAIVRCQSAGNRRLRPVERRTPLTHKSPKAAIIRQHDAGEGEQKQHQPGELRIRSSWRD